MKTLLAGALLVVAVAACGTGGASPAPNSAQPSLGSSAASSGSIAANATAITVRDFSLGPKDLTVQGTVQLAVTNAGPTVHNVSIRDTSGTVVGATKDLKSGQSETLSVDIPAGTYVMFCSLPGHESLGIKGTLTVTK